jgi:hypothetical protein
MDRDGSPVMREESPLAQAIIFIALVIFVLFVGTVWAVPG